MGPWKRKRAGVASPRLVSLLVSCLVLPLVGPAPARAGEADVVGAEVRCRPAPGGREASICQFSVSVRHDDTGWDHYANRYEIVGPDGRVLATRILRHPHVEEQPFRRSLPRVRIPWTIETVEVRAGDLVHGLGGRTMRVTIPHQRPAKETPAAGGDADVRDAAGGGAES